MVATEYKIAQGQDIALQSHIWHMRSYCEHIVYYVYMSLVTSFSWSNAEKINMALMSWLNALEGLIACST